MQGSMLLLHLITLHFILKLQWSTAILSDKPWQHHRNLVGQFQIFDRAYQENKKDPKPTTADKTVSSLLHIERDFQNLQTPTFSFQGKSQFKKFTLFLFPFCFVVSCWLGFFCLFVFLLYNIYNGRL